MNVLELDRATIHDWLDLCAYGDEGDGYVRTYARGQIVYDQRELFSYGRHFPLVRFVPGTERGRGADGRRRPDLFILNGDTWNGPRGWRRSRTPDHQETVRRRCEYYSGAETVILPFSALTGAGIDLDSVRLVHVRADARWTETLEARTLAELPRHERQVSYSVERTSETLEGVPESDRRTYRQRTQRELTEQGDEANIHAYGSYSYMPILPGADGLYRWTVTKYRDREPDDDGLYRWDANRHRLGDSLISAVRPERSVRRARPFESESSSARFTLALAADESGRSGHCGESSDYQHEAGPAASCIHCGAELYSVETWRRRALYLSSFDQNESPPLYFLAEVPPSSKPRTVESALDALAPRAVHAAMARGRHVARQGDIFFIDTELTRAELESRGATFARLTLWTRDAKPKRGEYGYVAPLTAKQRRRRAARELNHARRIFHATMFGELERETWHVARELARELTRAKHRELWRELEARHVAELEAVNGDASQLAPCGDCGAGAGAPCLRDGDSLCVAERRQWRGELGARQKSEREELARATRAPDAKYGRPETGADGRRRAQRNRVKVLAELESARIELRRVTLAGPRAGAYRLHRGYSLADQYVHALTQARERFEQCAARARRGELEPCLGARDGYRTCGRGRAVDTWRRALEAAQRKHRPETVWDTDRFRARRELARRACAIYGTAHSASELAHVRGAVYVRGTVRHVPDLEPNRTGAPDHRPLTLTEGRWYLAVRNTVPRQARRRRRRAARVAA